MQRRAADQAESDRLTALAASYGGGHDGAGESIVSILRPIVAHTVERFFAPADMDHDDLVQETLHRTLSYVRKNGGFAGDLVRFAVTVARNRCRTTYHWRQRWAQEPIEPHAELRRSPAGSPLDCLLESEVRELLDQALQVLDEECRILLSSFYLEGERLETIRERFGLRSTQALFYRKSLCLKSALRFLMQRLAVRSAGSDLGGGTPIDPTRQGGNR